MVMIEKTKLFLIFHLTGALIHYRFVVGKITGNSRTIFIMSLKVPYNMTRIKTRLWFGNNLPLFAFRTCLPNRVVLTPGVSTLLHQTPSVSVLLLRKKNHNTDNVLYQFCSS